MNSPLTKIDLQIKLPDVKKSENGNDVLIVPETWSHTINNFFTAHEIPFVEIEDPKLYPIEEIDRQLAKTVEPCWYPEDLNELRGSYGVTAFITEFDTDALREWALQFFSMEDKDPAYTAYREEEKRKAHEYYERDIKPWE